MRVDLFDLLYSAVISLVLGTLFLAPTSADAQASPLVEAATAVVTIDPVDQTVEQRRRLAHSLANHCRSLAEAIPTLSPRENEWLNVELEKRRMAAVDSIEFAKRITGSISKSCLTDAEALSGPIARREENFRWARLATTLIYDSFGPLLEVLHQNKSVFLPKERVKETELLHPLVGRHILERIVMPYLAMDLSQSPSGSSR